MPTDELSEKVAEAIRIMDEAATMFPASHLFGMFSGGHDSLCSTHLASKHPLFSGAAHINTTIGVEATRDFVRSTSAAQGWRLKEYLPPVSYRDIILKHGFPGPGSHLYMYSRLKERPVRALVREHKQRHGDHVLLATGVRASESKRRMGHVKPIQKEGARVWVAPIINWTTDDKNAYIDREGLRRNPVVADLCMSGECLCGAFAAPNELAELSVLYPDVAEEIRGLQREAAERGVHAVWGARPPGTRSPKKPPLSGAMCHSCDAKVFG